MAKAKHKKHGKSAHARADHGHGHADHGDAGHDDHSHGHDEPPPPPEPETPLWFSLLGGVLFILLGLVFLVFNGDDAPKADGEAGKGESAEAAKRPGGGAVAAQADDAAAAKRPPAPPVRRLQPGDLEKKR